MASAKHLSFALIVALTFGLAHPMEDDSEEVPDGARRFHREHLLHHFNGDTPSTEIDELALWEAPGGIRYFLLNTVGPNYHRCEVKGRLETIGSGELQFSNSDCTLSFREQESAVQLVVSDGWERLGACPKLLHCGMFGVVESGTFRRVQD